MKKALKTLLAAAIIMIIAVCTVSANDEADAHTDLLESLGIIDGSDRYRDGITTRAEFVTYILRLANIGAAPNAAEPEFTDVAKSHWAYGEISSAYAMGLICEKENGRFYPDSPVEAADAARMLLCAVGYTDYVKGMSDVNVMRLAESVKLFANASKSTGMPLERGDILEMLFNALSIDMPYLQGVTADGTPKYYLQSGKNILSERFGVYYTEGVVTADDNSVITGEAARAGGIAIDGTPYDGALSNAEDYVGYNVGCYWLDHDLSREIVTVFEKKNTVYEFSFADTEYTGTAFCEVTGTKRLNLRINAKTTILINGCVVRDSSQINASLADYAGTVKMIDNDRDGVYDIVILKRYVNIYIASYDDVDMVLSGKNGESFELDGYDDVVLKDSYLDNMDMSLLAVDSVLSVYMPLEKDKRVTLVMGGAAFAGELLSIDFSDERNMTLTCDDDVVYDISKFCMFNLQDIIVGENYTFYPDWRGEIAYVELGVENLKIGYVRRAVMSDTGDGVQLSIYGSDGGLRMFELKETVMLRNTDGAMTRVDDADVYNKLVIGGVIQRQPIMYKLTNDERISKLYLAAEDQSLMFHVLEDDVSKSSYRLEYRNNNFMGKYICTAQTIYMVVPKNSNSEDEYRMGTSGMFTNGSYVYFDSARTSVRMYAVEPDSFITDLMIYAVDYSAAKGVKEASEPVVYLKKTVTVNDDNERVCRITVIGYDGSEKTYDISDCEDEVYDMNGRTLHYGDIIRIAEDERGKYLSATIETMYDYAAGEHLQYLGSTTIRYLSVTRVIPADVTAREGNYIKFNTFAGYAPEGSGYKASTEIAQISSARVYVYDGDKNELVQSSPAKVAVGDKFVLYESYGVVRMIVYYK